jgi:uncharacterized membrane protein YfcA
VTYDPSRLAVIAVVVCGAALIKGAIGFGFPLLAIPVLSIVLGPHIAIPLVVFPTLLSNLILVGRGPGGRTDARPFILTLLGLAAGVVGGAYLINAMSPRTLSILVGGVSALYVVATATGITHVIPPRTGERAGPVIGIAAGVLGGSTGIFSPVLASYLHMLRLEKRAFVFWITMMFFVGNVVQFVSYLRLGLYGGPVLGTSVLACAPMAVGTWAGLRLQDSLHPEMFSRIVLGIVLLASLNLLVRGLLG